MRRTVLEFSRRTGLNSSNGQHFADAIYGVTMGRDSASQIISLKLDEVTDEFIGRV
jgi:hypothetical protein